MKTVKNHLYALLGVVNTSLSCKYFASLYKNWYTERTCLHDILEGISGDAAYNVTAELCCKKNVMHMPKTVSRCSLPEYPRDTKKRRDRWIKFYLYTLTPSTEADFREGRLQK